MRKMLYTCCWGNNEAKAWSGTKNGLYQEFKKYYEVERFDIDRKVFPLIFLRALERKKIARFDMAYHRFYTKKYLKQKEEHKDKIHFQFDECPNCEGIESYVFQDLSVGFLRDLCVSGHEDYKYCGLNMSRNYLEKRAKKQAEYYENATGIFTMGQWLADYIVNVQNVDRKKVHAVGGGINIDINKIDESQKTGNKILFVGRDFERKGGILVIEAFKKLKEKMPDAMLYLAGPSSNPVKENIEGYKYLGDLGYDELVKYYNMCDIFCMPSHFEAYGLVFAEALVFGLPCITRNAYSMKEFIKDGENGYLIDNDDVSVLADKMEMLLKNEEIKENVRKNRQYYVEKYSWKAVVERITDIINANNKEA